MALKIQNNEGTFDVISGFSVEIEDTSPVYNEIGSRSIAATLPASKNNLKLIGYPNHLDNDKSPNADSRVVVSDGVYRRIGQLNITQASIREGIVSNIGFDESEIYSQWSKVTLQSLPDLPVYSPGGAVPDILNFMNNLLQEKISHEALHVFQICVALPKKDETVDDKEVTTYYPEYLNAIYKDGSVFKVKGDTREETYLLDNEVVTTTLPAGYGLTPFLKVSWLIDFIFSTYGYTVSENPFAGHPQLSRLVVLNNAADCCVKGFINYADLLPECTINEFFQALYCRFGLIYFVDGRTKNVRLRFIKDIISSPEAQDWTNLKAGEPLINYNSPTQLKLSASTSIAGPYQGVVAAPAAESLDTFLQPYNYIVADTSSGYLYYIKHTGMYVRRNVYTGVANTLSSDFFPWDRGANIEYQEITSADECLPVKTSGYPDDNYLCPAYLRGKVHRYTTIESADIELDDEKNKSIPLCFCFAHPYSSYDYPFGSPRCYTPSGKQVVDSSGHIFDISLTFVGEHGAFNRFWKGYDAILRHANLTVEVEMHLDHNTLLNTDYGQPVAISGQRLLPDLIRYTLPLRKSQPANVQLRSLKLLKPYNLEEEQNVPIVKQLYKWAFYSDKLDVRTAEIYLDVNEYKSKLVYGAIYMKTLYKNEVEDPISDADIPFTVPSEAEGLREAVFFIKKVNYSFTVYHQVQNTSGQVTENKGKDYSIQYSLKAKATPL